MTESCVLPEFDLDQVAAAARQLFGLGGTVRNLDGERDLNFLIESDAGKYVFKIANENENPAMLECQHEVFERVNREFTAQGLPIETPVSLRSVNGNVLETVHSRTGIDHTCRVVSFVDGKLLSAVNPHSPALLEKIGGALGTLDGVLEGYQHTAIERPLLWNMVTALETLDRFSPLLEDPEKAGLIQRFRKKFASRVNPVSEQLRLSTIHNDANDNNLVICGDDPWSLEVRAVIDFGDMVYSWTVAEPAIAAAYVMLGKEKPLDAALCVIRGFHNEYPLTETDVSVLFELACMRLCLSVAICAHQQSLDPENQYLRVSEQPAWEALRKLDIISPDFAHFCFRDACGLDPVPGANRVTGWLKNNSADFASILDIDLSSAPLMVLDASVSSPYLDRPGAGFDAEIAAREIFRLLEDNHCVAGIGRYDEYRLIYSSDDFIDSSGHQRTLHLGIDVFMPEGTPLYAPLPGTVFCAENNDAPLDYGGTLILEHAVSDGEGEIVFHTLYGHLSPQSIDHFEKGDRISAGQQVARMGGVNENGNWAPHVHFEIITDLLGQTNTFVGVGTHEQRDVWLALCPDPNAMLGIPGKLLDTGEKSPDVLAETIAGSRNRHLSPSLSLSYRNPVHMARADMQYMYDYTGRRYLDAVNNVPHVGHCHPRVAEAAARQCRILNTNTRYLYREIEQYSERLLGTFPEPLEVCFLVNSGSEANDLALRLAMNFSGHDDKVILDHAYHGNLSSLIEISPYKHNGKGGSGAPDNVHTALLPELFRGRFRGQSDYERAVALDNYIDDASQAVDAARDRGGLGLFIAESIPGCGGQVVLPEGYLSRVYALVRHTGGICIADEVQVGFGRVGTHHWAFQTQNVIPDIVTLGKPIGNGHPLAAVITSREIADAFNNGMEYFNTFGGNPVSCAVGNAVLDVMESEGLQENALEVGNHLLSGLARLQEKFGIVGDVRGLGLFIGIELVYGNDLSPAARQADYVAERMKQQGILISTDGPDHNVLKIKPPLCFSLDNADQLVSTLELILQEDFSQPQAFPEAG